MDIFNEDDYRSILANEFAIRKQRRPSYSIRAFARDLGTTSSRLSAVMKGRYGLSASVAKDIAEKLHFNDQQTQYFVDLVESLHSRTKIGREQAKKRLQKKSRSKIFKSFEDESSSDFISKWFYPAVLELISIDKKITAPQIASQLEISVSETDEAIQLLLRLGRITKSDGKFKVREEFLLGESSTPKELYRKFHAQVLEQMKNRISEVPVEKRRNFSAVFSFDSSKTKEASAWLDKMNEEFLEKFCTDGKDDSVMAFGVHLIPLTAESVDG